MAESLHRHVAGHHDTERLSVSRNGDELVLYLRGDWLLEDGLSHAGTAIGAAAGQIKLIRFNDAGIDRWDSSLVAFVTQVLDYCRDRRIKPNLSSLPEGVRRLVSLANAVPTANTGSQGLKVSRVAKLGLFTIGLADDVRTVVRFLGELALSGMRLIRGRARFRRRDFFFLLQQCGVEALPIVTVISLLVGLILAFVGALQLRIFGAESYVANLVGIAVLREMGAIMTGIVLAGRTGAAFAAQIGAMQGNEEIDALSTLAVPAMDFLVLPRALALILMMPLLCIYADMMGILGGLIVSTGMLNITSAGYFHQLLGAISLTQVFIGLSKSVVFGIIVAVSGCMKGLNCGRSAADVGNAATQAVVMGILFIIVFDGVFAVILNALGL